MLSVSEDTQFDVIGAYYRIYDLLVYIIYRYKPKISEFLSIDFLTLVPTNCTERIHIICQKHVCKFIAIMRCNYIYLDFSSRMI